MPEPAGRPDPGDEPVEWVDEDGTVIEVVTRRRVRAEVLRHRCTYVAVLAGPPDLLDRGPLDPSTPIWVHRRADWKDVYPGHWDLAFGGVCGVGEPWGVSARRELAEEAGIEVAADGALVDLGPVRYDEDDGRLVGRVFLVAWPDAPVSTDGEAVAFARIPLSGLEAWLAETEVCPDSALLVAPAVLARVAST